MDGLLCHLGVGACERLQCLIGMRVSLATQDGLYGLSHDSPSVVEVGGDGLLVEYELAQTLQRALHGYDTVAERHTDVAQHGRVGKVTLQTAHGQLLCEELQHGVSQTEVTLRVLKVDGVHLVGHGA